MSLSILCVSNLGAHTDPFLHGMNMLARGLGAEFVLCVDVAERPVDTDSWRLADCQAHQVRSDGYIESVLDDAIGLCNGDYVLRLDDDEKVSPPMEAWLRDGGYREADHWAFPRMHLWPGASHYLINPPLWPDLQTRLSVKAKAGGRTQIHQGSPHGTGRVANGIAIEHHKFLVRDRGERERLMEHYEGLLPGADAWAAFSVPELFDGLTAEPVPW